MADLVVRNLVQSSHQAAKIDDSNPFSLYIIETTQIFSIVARYLKYSLLILKWITLMDHSCYGVWTLPPTPTFGELLLNLITVISIIN